MLINNPVITGSFIVNGTNFITNTPSTGSNTFNGNQIISGSAIVTGSLQVTGSVTTTGTITAQTLVVQTVTSSVVFSSGSNIFGNSLSNRQQMTGSVSITGSLTTSTPLTVDGTKKIFLRSNQGTGGGLISGSAIGAMGNFSIYSDDGVAGDILGMYYWNGGTYRSALQFANVSSGNSNLILMKDGGNVGIGTTLVSAKLVVVGGTSNVGSSTSDYTVALQDPTSMAINVGGSILLQGYKTGTAAIGNFAYVAGKKENGTAGNEAGYLAFGTFDSSGIPSEKMRITSNGGVKIGSTGASSAVRTEAWGYSTTSSTFSLIAYNSSGFGVLVCRDDWQVSLASLGTGTVYSNGGALTNTNPSDLRLKTNVESIKYGLNEILQLNPVTYNLKEDKLSQGKQYGFIAQEVQEVMPDLVKPLQFEEDLLGLDKEAIYTVLVKAIQEQQAQIEILKTEIETLKNK